MKSAARATNYACQSGQQISDGNLDNFFQRAMC
jgi:hypothetical protein